MVLSSKKWLFYVVFRVFSRSFLDTSSAIGSVVGIGTRVTMKKTIKKEEVVEEKNAEAINLN